MRFAGLVACAIVGCCTSSWADPGAPPSLETNRAWEILPGDVAPAREMLRRAGSELAEWRISLAGVEIDGARLVALSNTPPSEPLLRSVREGLGRAVDLDDLLLFLDDLLRAGRSGLRGRDVFVTASRARASGILVHPDDVFGGTPRRYGPRARLHLDRPRPQQQYPPAVDGEVLGPNWTMRFQNPATESARMAALRQARPLFAERVQSLLDQLQAQGAAVYLDSTLRRRERGYLIWGAFLLRSAKSDREVRDIVSRLERARRAWGIDATVSWSHPEGWRRTVDAAREMADTYGVAYATEQGARFSHHYSGRAVDLEATGLPRLLTLEAPDGARETFDLSDPGQPRDLNLTPELIDWIEVHFSMTKLRSDYPHWADAQP